MVNNEILQDYVDDIVKIIGHDNPTDDEIEDVVYKKCETYTKDMVTALQIIADLKPELTVSSLLDTYYTARSIRNYAFDLLYGYLMSDDVIEEIQETLSSY